MGGLVVFKLYMASPVFMQGDGTGYWYRADQVSSPTSKTAAIPRSQI